LRQGEAQLKLVNVVTVNVEIAIAHQAGSPNLHIFEVTVADGQMWEAVIGRVVIICRMAKDQAIFMVAKVAVTDGYVVGLISDIHQLIQAAVAVGPAMADKRAVIDPVFTAVIKVKLDIIIVFDIHRVLENQVL